MRDHLSVGHFDAIAPRYAGSTGGLDALYDAVRPELDRLLAGRDVLDVGGGGAAAYDPAKPRSVTMLDVSARMLERAPAGVRTVLADARDMRPCADAAYDAALFSLSAHHIAARAPAETDDGLRAAFAEAWRVLRPGGLLLVYEPVLGPVLHAAGRAAFPLVRAALSSIGAPMVHFQSRASLRRLLESACGAPVSVSRMPATGWSDPLGGVLPGVVRMPLALYPTRFDLFRAEKPRG